ncbi:uncharacterized protein LOC110433932 isoform X2 [Sorghum bicolor]|uniref:uncharacterized protein LOC110433932 isoform X2 n=1 Tax=Sorghum bicolor TaxID=4558 RepID=UPI000B423F6F|nr:uncharacterized protein LOC110433932 isoform X2 [Sorghum bicolor]|eukprot:XP_021312764.1 uncharacterized protein LOC110433932 isoform X2 [Sorghum bicolor]
MNCSGWQLLIKASAPLGKGRWRHLKPRRVVRAGNGQVNGELRPAAATTWDAQRRHRTHTRSGRVYWSLVELPCASMSLIDAIFSKTQEACSGEIEHEKGASSHE